MLFLADPLASLILALAAILLAARVMGALARRLGQPAVVGEILAGIALGPSLLGGLWPEAGALIFSPASLPVLGRLADLGVILFMFLVGLEFDPGALRGRGRATVAVSLAGIAVPFGLGFALAAWLHPIHGPEGTGFLPFAMFLGTAMSVTAFPVLARILGDLGLAATPLGRTALASAAVDDISAWCLLAGVVGLAQGTSGLPLRTLGLAAAYVAVMLVVGRPLVRRLAVRLGAATEPGDYSLMVALALLSALVTDVIGIHPLFGAFLFGALIPHDSPVAREAHRRMETLVTGLFLPIFFAWSGLRTHLGLLDDPADWAACGAILAVAFLGKAGGVYAAGRAVGVPHRDATALGVLMNTRGLVELVVLNVGLDLGVIQPTLFTMLVLMALVTTLATTPLLRVLTGARLRQPVPLSPGS